MTKMLFSGRGQKKARCLGLELFEQLTSCAILYLRQHTKVFVIIIFLKNM